MRGWAQRCCSCPELCSSPGPTGKQVVTAGPARPAGPRNWRSPGTTSPQFFPFCPAFHCSALQFMFSNSYCPSKPAPLVLPQAEAHSDRGDTQLLTSAAGVWSDCRWLWHMKDCQQKPFSMTKAKEHRILCNSALKPCHLIRGPKTEVLESLCWPAKAW